MEGKRRRAGKKTRQGRGKRTKFSTRQGKRFKKKYRGARQSIGVRCPALAQSYKPYWMKREEMKEKSKRRFLRLLEILDEHQHLLLSDQSNRQYIAGLFVQAEEDYVQKEEIKVRYDGDGKPLD